MIVSLSALPAVDVGNHGLPVARLLHP